MKEFILLMHDDGGENHPADWQDYLAKLGNSGRLLGGSSIGTGVCVSKTGDVKAITEHITGYIRVKAEDLDAAKTFVEGNPVFETGGTVEIRELPRDQE